MTGPATVQFRDTTFNGQPGYVCTFPLTLTTSGGRPGDNAYFTYAEYTVDVQGQQDFAGTLAANYLFNPNTSIAAGDTLTGTISVIAKGDYQLSLGLYYSTPETNTESTGYISSCE